MKPIQCNLAAAVMCSVASVMAQRASAQTPPGLDLQLYAGLTVTGAVGTVYSVEYVTDLAQTNSWRRLEYLQLPATPYLWADKSAPATGQRFYGAVVFDMHGNVIEWCQDWYGPYTGGVALDPQGPATGSSAVSPPIGPSRTFRGGDWGHPDAACRAAFRFSALPSSTYQVMGFRVVLAPGQP